MNVDEALRAAMVERLVASGVLRSQAWIEAFAQVPRHVFVRRFYRQSADLAGWEAVSERDAGALDLVYADQAWVTQLDNDPDRWELAYASGEAVPGIPSSSSSAPGLMALMLEALAVDDHHRVLEIGTGTGYHAALLCHRLGSALVATVEVDASVAGVAQGCLGECGYHPVVVVADGADGHPAGAPYDRLIATCAIPAVPAAWIDQVRPGGLVLASLHRDLGGGALVLLRVDPAGRAEGRFLPDHGSFMPVRASPAADAPARLVAALDAMPVAEATRAGTVAAEALERPDFGMVVALRLPGVASIEFTPETGTQRWLLADDGSWAYREESTGMVSQHGARRLWDEVEQIHREWTQWGEPARERFGLTVTAGGEHRFWLDDPARVHWVVPS